jgi:hypothetical protein
MERRSHFITFLIKLRPIVLIMILGCGSYVNKPLRPAEYAMAGVFAATATVDWHQTQYHIQPQCMEWNPVIGPCGNRMQVSIYMPLVVFGTLAIAKVLPEKYRLPYLAAMAGSEFSTIITNHLGGYGW